MPADTEEEIRDPRAPEPRAEDEQSVRFDDPEWDDEFCTWLDNGLRTCCG